jgi:hypothetical protein
MITPAGAASLHKLQPGDLVLNTWPESQAIHSTANLLSEVPKLDLTDGGVFFTPGVFCYAVLRMRPLS